MATAIGSFPYTDPQTACDIILRSVPDIPLWPQLPNTDFREQMEIQYCEGMPRVVLDEAARKMYFDTSGDITGDLEKFYENIFAENLDYFAISPAFSRGLYRMEDILRSYDRSSIKYFKTQVTGPVTFGLNRVDENKRAIYYNDIFRDIVVKCIVMKARWALNRFKHFGFDQICFIDEPIFSAFGSSTYVSVQRSDVVQYLGEVVGAVHEQRAIAGSHCCGNTEWTILIDAGVDIISFDAYEYGETIGYYPEQIGEFLRGGGVLAWGIVPTSEKINEETPDSIVRKLEQLIEGLAGKGIDKNLIWEQCLITPSCGTGSRSVELAGNTFNQLSEVSRILRR
jgi:methionine synthase II (cobalamin-independent)